MTSSEFIKSLETKFNPESAEGNTVFHFEVSGEGGGKFTASVVDGVCKVTEGFDGEPACKITTSNDVLVGVVTKQKNAQMAFMMGQIKVTNLGAMMKYAKAFGLM